MTYESLKFKLKKDAISILIGFSFMIFIPIWFIGMMTTYSMVVLTIGFKAFVVRSWHDGVFSAFDEYFKFIIVFESNDYKITYKKKDEL